MEIKLSARPVKFKLNEYLNKGFELFKKDMGTFVLAFIFMGILSIFPFFALMATGNFLKICRKINNGQQASATDIFNFDDFWIFFKLLLIILFGVIAVELPLFFFISRQEDAEPSAFFFIYFLALIVFIFYVSLKAYYMVALISLENVKSIKEAWNMSKLMTTNNLLTMLLFSIIIGFIGELGILACFVGLIFTLPLMHVLQYVSYEDAIQQIKVSEVE